MAFIRVQKLIRDNNGNITSGSAAIKESRYVKNGGKFHSRQIVRERNFMLEHPDEYAAMNDQEKDWLSVRFGYFVLLSNRDLTPAELLTEYFGRTGIEGVIKAGKEYLGLHPLFKWTVDTVRGKILSDIMNTIIFLQMRKALDDSGLSAPEITGRTQSLMCMRNKHGEILVETPNKKVKAYYQLLGETIPGSLKISDFRKKVLAS